MDNKRWSATFLLLPQLPYYPQHDRLYPPRVINQGKLFLLLSISVSYHSNRKLVCVWMCVRMHVRVPACVCVRMRECVCLCVLKQDLTVWVKWSQTCDHPPASAFQMLRLPMRATVPSGSGIRNFYNCKQMTSLVMWFLIHHFFLFYFYSYKIKIL